MAFRTAGARAVGSSFSPVTRGRLVDAGEAAEFDPTERGSYVVPVTRRLERQLSVPLTTTPGAA